MRSLSPALSRMGWAGRRKGWVRKTKVLKIDPADPDSKVILTAAKIIKEGGLVAFPTETVYGIAANLFDRNAMDKLDIVKNRPKGKPYTVHISNINMIRKMGCVVTKSAAELMGRFWPGPLTIILGTKTGEKIGFRMPANKIALDLIKAVGLPVVAPSANTSGNKAPTSARAVLNSLDGKIDILLDSGETDVGIESTVVDLTSAPPKVLREGAIPHKELLKIFES